MIISGGENIYCAEVENVLAAHPAIVEVAVIGRPHDEVGRGAGRGGRRQRAPDSGWRTSTEFLNERLARYKHPKALEIVDALPRNPAGKVLKTELRRVRFAANVPRDNATGWSNSARCDRDAPRSHRVHSCGPPYYRV